MVSDKKTLQRRFTMIKNNMKISKKAIVISVILVLAVIGSTVFASGMLNGKLVDEPELVSSEIQGPDNTAVIQDNDTNKSNKATDEPKLVPVTGVSEKTASNTQSEEEISEPVLNVIELDANMENPVDGEISINFGKREHPITKDVQEHNGVDIKATEGTDVVSSIQGTVTDVGFDSEKGNYIVVENGNIKTLYAQLAETKVNKGDKIVAKQSIGTVGKTGKATGAHLHFEVMVDGEYVNPTDFIK